MQPGARGPCQTGVATLQVVTTFGETLVDHAMVAGSARFGDVVVHADRGVVATDGRELAVAPGAPVHVRWGQATITIAVTERPKRAVPREPIDRRMLAFLVGSIAVHAVVLAIAQWAPTVDRPRGFGAPRPRLVANHATSARGQRAPIELPSPHTEDTRESIALDANPPRTPHGAQARRSEAAQRERVAARHDDPCSDGHCGAIETSPYETTSHGRAAGDEFALAPRKPLDLSFVECSPERGCNTVTGVDSAEIRTELGHHVDDLDACFALDPAAKTAALDIRIDRGTVTTDTHGDSPVSRCVAGIVAKLSLTGDRPEVTLAFARD